jgi:hypothetical protein
VLGCLQHALKRNRTTRVNFMRIAKNNLGWTFDLRKAGGSREKIAVPLSFLG